MGRVTVTSFGPSHQQLGQLQQLHAVVHWAAAAAELAVAVLGYVHIDTSTFLRALHWMETPLQS